MSVAVFDFDWTLLDEDSDVWVFKNLDPKLLSKVLYQSKFKLNSFYLNWQKLKTYHVWTDAVSSGLEALQHAGVTVEQISQTLSSIPFNAKTKTLIEYLSSKGITLMIASDANTFYINEILRHFNILQYFERIFTNYGIIEDGKLTVSRYVPADTCHGCSQCPANLCKVWSRMVILGSNCQWSQEGI